MFSLLTLGMLLLGAALTYQGPSRGHAFFSFRPGAIELLFAVWASIEGGAGGLVASFFLLSMLARKPLRRVVRRLLFVHTIPVALLGLILGASQLGVIGCGFWAFTGGSFAISCAWIVRSIPNIACPCHCTHCSYDMTGNVSGICPECGTAFALPPGPSDHPPQ